MDLLGDDLWVVVLAHLGNDDLVRVSRTCSRLHQLAMHPALWKRLSLPDARRHLPNARDMMRLISRTGRLSSVDLLGCAVDNAGLLAIAERAATLRTLKLGRLPVFGSLLDSRPPSFGGTHVRSILSEAPNLRELAIIGVDNLVLGSSSPTFPAGLQHLCLWGSRPSSASDLTRCIEKCGSLESLNLRAVEISSPQDAELARAMSRLICLRRVCIELPAAIPEVWGFLADLRKLCSVSLACAPNSTRAVKRLLHASHRESLRHLTMDRAELGTRFSFPNLTSIDVNYAFMPSDLKAMLRASPLLVSLVLSCCDRLSDQSLSDIAEGCKMLRQLSLVRTSKVTSRGFAALAGGTFQLEVLHLKFCAAVDDEILSALLQRCGRGMVDLELSHTNCSSAVLDVIAEVCGLALCRLSAAQLKEGEHGGEEGAHLSQLALKCRNISHLSLVNFTALSGKDMQVIGHNLQRLVELRINGCTGITEKMLRSLLESRPSLALLRCPTPYMSRYQIVSGSTTCRLD